MKINRFGEQSALDSRSDRCLQHPDGAWFAVALAQTPGGAKQDHVTFLFNFFDELRRIAPVKR